MRLLLVRCDIDGFFRGRKGSINLREGARQAFKCLFADFGLTPTTVTICAGKNKAACISKIFKNRKLFIRPKHVSQIDDWYDYQDITNHIGALEARGEANFVVVGSFGLITGLAKCIFEDRYRRTLLKSIFDQDECLAIEINDANYDSFVRIITISDYMGGGSIES